VSRTRPPKFIVSWVCTFSVSVSCSSRRGVRPWQHAPQLARAEPHRRQPGHGAGFRAAVTYEPNASLARPNSSYSFCGRVFSALLGRCRRMLMISRAVPQALRRLLFQRHGRSNVIIKHDACSSRGYTPHASTITARLHLPFPFALQPALVSPQWGTLHCLPLRGLCSFVLYCAMACSARGASPSPLSWMWRGGSVRASKMRRCGI